MKHVAFFEAKKMLPGETLITSMVGWIGKMFGKGSDAQQNGAFVVTNQRVAFIRKGLFGEVFETIPLTKISSVETRSKLGHRIATFYASHQRIDFKTFAEQEEFAAFLSVVERRGTPSGLSSRTAPPNSLVSDLEKLVSLRNDGSLSKEDYDLAKSHLIRTGSISSGGGITATRQPMVSPPFQMPDEQKTEKSNIGRIGIAALLLGGCWFLLSGGFANNTATTVTAQSPSTSTDAEPEPSPVRKVTTTKVVQKTWDDMRVCTGAVQAYFFLTMTPRYLGGKGGNNEFRSEAGNRYDCTVIGDRASLRWINGAGQSMTSESTRHWIDDSGTLHVKTDMVELTFD